MRRAGRRLGNDFLEENEELTENYNNYEPEDYADYSEDVADSEEDIPVSEKTSNDTWKKIGKVLLVIIILVALFFTSMKITEIYLDRESEPVNYGNDAPDISDTFEDSESSYEEPTDIERPDDVLGDEVASTPSSTPSETQKPEETTKPEETQKPEESTKPEETVPPTEPTPSKPSKPVIIPGNPAA